MPVLRFFVLSLLCVAGLRAADLERIKYNHPGLKVDLGVGLSLIHI